MAARTERAVVIEDGDASSGFTKSGEPGGHLLDES